MPNMTMVIPSYWGRATGDPINNEKILFDHPTALNETGTLARLLARLASENPFANFDTKSWLQSLTTHWQQLTSALEGIGLE